MSLQGKLQFETVTAEAEYYKEIHALDIKYQKVYDAINARRTGVIKGDHEPAGDEIEWPSDEEDEDKKEESLANGVEKMTLKDHVPAGDEIEWPSDEEDEDK